MPKNKSPQKKMDGCFGAILATMTTKQPCIHWVNELMTATENEIVSQACKAGIVKESVANKAGDVSNTLVDKKRSARKKTLQQTITIFDWDDTIFATTDCMDRSHLSASFLSRMKKQDRVAAKLLQLALQYSSVFIVTNAQGGWVEETAERFMPKVSSLLSKITVMSARDLYQSRFPNDAQAWKVCTFLDVSADLPQIPTNLIAIGDSNFEMEAARIMGAKFEDCITKTVKLRAKPSQERLTKELQDLTDSFSTILSRSEDVDYHVSRLSS